MVSHRHQLYCDLVRPEGLCRISKRIERSLRLIEHNRQARPEGLSNVMSSLTRGIVTIKVKSGTCSSELCNNWVNAFIV